MNRTRITLSAFLAYFCVSGVLSTFGLISGPMAQHFAVEVTQITRGFGWFTFGMLIGAGLAIELVDRFPLRTLLISTFLIVALCLGSMVRTGSLMLIWPMFGITGICLGVGLATAASTIARSYAPEPRASMLVMTDACFSLAGKLCAALALLFLGYQWHWSSGYWIVASAAALVVLLAMMSNYPEVSASDASSKNLTDQQTNVSQSKSTPSFSSVWTVNIGLCIAALCLYTLGQYAMLWWLPQHLQASVQASPAEAGAVVGQFWLGMFWAQLVVAWWVLKVGATRLVLVSAISAAVCSVPLWLTTDLQWIPWLGALWGFGNLAFLKIAISFATELQVSPSPRLVSALLFGATSGTAISPWVTSQIVESFGTATVLRFSTLCYCLIVVIISVVVFRRTRNKPVLAPG